MPQLHSRHDAIHLLEESLSAGGFVLLIKCDLGNRLFVHGCVSLSVLRHP